jgi:molecular chaperone DnaK
MQGVSMPVTVGIDLGTTFSAVAIVKQGKDLPEIIPTREGEKITPSVIQFVDGKPIFGSEAWSAFKAGESNCVTTFKRDMGKSTSYCDIDGSEYTSEQLSALLLGHLKVEAEYVLGDTIGDAVITVPAYFLSREREATINAAKRAGLKIKKLIDEPNAAAMAYGLGSWRENANILVYDLGGGTFDVSLIRMEKNGILETKTTCGDHELGGKDWDNRLISLLLEKIAEETGFDVNDDYDTKAMIRGSAEGVKKQLSELNKAKITIKEYTINVTRDEFENVTKDLIERTGNLCQTAVRKAGLKNSDITDVLLVGGSTRMPQVKKYLSKMFGKEPISHVNPDEAVALGAAIQATKENDAYLMVDNFKTHLVDGKLIDDRKILDVRNNLQVLPARKLNVGLMTLHETTAHAMGIIAINPDNTRYINDIIIPANHRRPVKVAKAFGFHTSSRGANEMEIYVLQGDYENPLKCDILPYKYVVSGIRHIKEQRGKTTIRVQYSYDNNGIIQVTARQENDKNNLDIRKEPKPEDMSKYGLPIDPNEFLKPEQLSVVLAVDVSGSMLGVHDGVEALTAAQNAMNEFIKKMDFSHTQVGVIAVADRAVKVIDLTDDERKSMNAIQSVRNADAGGANAGHPFDMIKSMLVDQEGKRIAIVLADGAWQCQSEAIKVAKECNSIGIDTAAIGFGSADYTFLQNISNTEAQLVSQSELTQAFGSIAQSLGGTSNTKSGSDGIAFDTDTWEDDEEKNDRI